MKVIDCFTFCDELTMLEFRLLEMSDVVDYFVIVEANTWHKTGQPRELVFEKNKTRFEPYKDKIIYVVVDDMPDTKDPWERERFQRRCIMRGLQRINCADSDIIIISDCDEIIDTNTISKMKKKGLNNIYSLEQDLYWYSLYCKMNELWYGPKVMNYGLYCTLHPKVPCIRTIDVLQNVSRWHEGKGGWHLTYFFNDIQKLKEKFQERILPHFEGHDFSHWTEEFIKNHMLNCGSHEQGKYCKRQLDKYLPKHYEFWLQEGRLFDISKFCRE